MAFGSGDDDSFDCFKPTIGIQQSSGESWIETRVEDRIVVRCWDLICPRARYTVTNKMSKRVRKSGRAASSVVDRREEARLKEIVESVGLPREPMVKFYRLPGDGRHILVGAISLDEFPMDSCEEYLREMFGGGEYLVRTVRSNGTFGPSRTVRIAERRYVHS